MELGPGTDLSFYIHQGVGSGLSSYTADAKVQCMELGPGTDLGFYAWKDPENLSTDVRFVHTPH